MAKNEFVRDLNIDQFVITDSMHAQNYHQQSISIDQLRTYDIVPQKS